MGSGAFQAPKDHSTATMRGGTDRRPMSRNRSAKFVVREEPMALAGEQLINRRWRQIVGTRPRHHPPDVSLFRGATGRHESSHGRAGVAPSMKNTSHPGGGAALLFVGDAPLEA